MRLRLLRWRRTAKEAVRTSERNLEQVKARWGRVHAVADEAQQQMRTNHLAPTIAAALGQRRRP